MTSRSSAAGRLLTTLVLAGLILASAAADASAQVRFSLAGGPAMALGDLGDRVDAGYHAQLGVALSLPLVPIGIRVDGMFAQFPETAEDANFRVLSGSVNGILSLPSVLVSPYLIGGAGLYNSRAGEDEADSEGTTDVGANLGVGVSVGLPGLSVFGEARFHNVFGDGASIRFVPVSVGIRF